MLILNRYVQYVWLLLWLVLTASVSAQTVTPSADEMIQQLKVPRTRSLRNLSVQKANDDTADATPQQASQDTLQEASPATDAAPAEPGAPADATPPRPSLSLQIQFELNAYRVSPQSQAALLNLAQALQSPELKGVPFSIEGHTDASGSASYNLQLSKKRADSVRDFLLAQGIAAERLLAQGKGSTEPANPQDPLAPENRRVRIVNLQ